MDYKRIETLINEGLTNETFDEIKGIFEANKEIQNEAKTTDADGDLVTLSVAGDIIEYIRRSSKTDTDGTDDGVYAKRLTRLDGIITVTDLY